MRIKRIVFITALFMMVGLPYGTGNAQVEVVTHMEMQPDMIVGVALFPDGVTPVADLPIRVWSSRSGRVIFRSRTDKDGVFSVPKIDTGDCYVFVGRVRINLKIMELEPEMAYQHNDIVIVIPRGMLVTANPVAVGPSLMDVLIAPALIAPIQAPKVVSP